MKAITVQQPWAECIAASAKLIENRSRPLSHRGPIAIHAGMRSSDRGYADPRVGPLLEGDGFDRTKIHGAVIAVAQLVDCHSAAGCCKPWGDDTYAGRNVYHLVLEDVRRVIPAIPASGRLGLWTLDDRLVP